MKRIAVTAMGTATITALPGLARAHGVHLIEAGPSGHAVSHVAPVLGLAVVVLAALLALRSARG